LPGFLTEQNLMWRDRARTVAEKVVTGAIRPVPPYSESSAAEIGAGSPDAAVQLFVNGSSSAAYEKPWSPTLSAGGIAALEDGREYTLILVGPYPGFAARRWWNDPLVTVVANDP